MKKITLLFAACVIAIGGYSQKKIDVKESNESFSTGSHNALSVMVYGAEKDDVEKAWKKQLKDLKGNVKAKKEIFADDCRIKKMSDNTFDVYSFIEETDDGVRVVAGIDLGGAYLSSGEHKDEFPFLRDMMYNFGVTETKAAIGSIIKDEEKKLEDLEDEKEDFEKDIEKLKKDIEDYKKKIEDAEKDIEENKSNIEKKKEEIKTQEAVVKEVQEKQKAVK